MKGVVRVPLQMAGLLILASGVGLAANQIRWDKNRIILSRNYFPAKRVIPEPPKPVERADARAVDSPPLPTADTAAPVESPPQHEFTPIDFQGIADLMESESFMSGMSIIVDARDDEHYLEARIPGAYQLDHYRLEEYLPDLEPIALGADLIVVYCNGGTCEDSILVARDLVDIGVLQENIRLYEGGIKDWENRKGPVDAGETE
ncbi:MAG: rhodanese-like domain-containing protein [Phycisphaerae bacterium]